MQGRATISDCGKYRYWLSRTWGDRNRRVIYVMLNPSTADALQDDPTIRRCITFAQKLGCGALGVVNLYAFRTPDPKELTKALKEGTDVLGPRNAGFVRSAVKPESGIDKIVVCAWGSSRISYGDLPRRSPVIGLIPPTAKCFGFNKDGNPKHPLYLPNNSELQDYSDQRSIA